jgi:hypothetical protein
MCCRVQHTVLTLPCVCCLCCCPDGMRVQHQLLVGQVGGRWKCDLVMDAAFVERHFPRLPVTLPVDVTPQPGSEGVCGCVWRSEVCSMLCCCCWAASGINAASRGATPARGKHPSSHRAASCRRLQARTRLRQPRAHCTAARALSACGCSSRHPCSTSCTGASLRWRPRRQGASHSPLRRQQQTLTSTAAAAAAPTRR